MWRSYLAASSVGRRTVRPVSPVLTAFSDALALPAAVLGPVDRSAFFLLAAARAGKTAVSISSFVSRADSMQISIGDLKRVCFEATATSVGSALWRSALRANFFCLRSRARRMDRAVIGCSLY